MDGLLVIDKPAGITSHDVVYRTRRILHERRIGHTGTLDPFATGVLLILVGRATRLAQFFSGNAKHYDAIIRLGYSTDTGDLTGTRIDTEGNQTKGDWSEGEIESALESLRGYIDQVPPMYSAKKKDGKRLYELARRGEEVEREPVRVCIHEFSAIKPGGQLIKDNRDGTFDFRVHVACSAGTYVRSLAEDFGKRLGVGAHLAELRRTRVGEFDLDSAVTLEELQTKVTDESFGTVLTPPSSALSFMPLLHLTDDDSRRVRNGMEVKVEETAWSHQQNIRMCDRDGTLVAVGEYDANKNQLRPRIVFAVE